MKNNFITKIIGATLAFAMMIGGAVGINVTKQAKMVDADTTGHFDITISNFTEITTSYTTEYSHNYTVETSTVTVKAYGVYKNANGIQMNSGKGTYIKNTTALPGYITSIVCTWTATGKNSPTLYVNSGAVASKTSTSLGKGSNSQTTQTYNVSNASTANMRYFYFDGTTVTGACYLSNFRINYTVPSGVEPVGPTQLATPEPHYDSLNNKVTWAAVANASSYQVKVGSGNYATATSPYDGNFQSGTEYTVYVKAIGDGEDYSDSEAGSVHFTAVAPFASKNYVLCTSTTDLEAGAKYLITNGTSGTVKTMSTADSSNNRPETNITITDSQAATAQDTLTVTLGGSSGAWTFSTDNYAGTAGYLASGTSSNNHLRVIANADNCTIAFNGNAAVIVFSSNTGGRNIVRYNSSSKWFACYGENNTQADVYLWREYTSKTPTNLAVTGTPSKLTGYFDSDTFDPAGITAYQVTYSDSSTKVVPASDIVWPPLTANMGKIKGSYTERGTTLYTPEYDISVAADTMYIEVSGTMVTSYYTTDSQWNKGNLVVQRKYTSGKNTTDVTASSTFAYYRDSAMTDAVASPAALGEGENQTIYVKATCSEVSNTTGYAQVVSVTIEHGTLQNDPLTVDEAITKGLALSSKGVTENYYYISGVVSSVEENSLSDAEKKYATFTFDDNNGSAAFKAYQIQAAEGCENYSALRSGAEVLIKCKIYKYNSTTIENSTSGSSILSISYTAPTLTGISLNKTLIYLGVGEDDNLTVSPIPVGAELGAVAWSSSNTNAVTVDENGHVTAVGVGDATITASAGGFEATCSIKSALKATAEYSGTTTNMAATGNAGTINLDSNLFSVDAAKGGNNYFPGLNADGDIRLYSGNDVIISANSNYTITNVVIDYKSGDSYAKVYVGSTLVSGTNSVYTINDDSFKIHSNGGTIKINSIDIFYRNATAAEKISRSTTQTQLSYRYTGNAQDGFEYSDISIRFGANITKALWDELDTNEHLISGFGVIIADGDLVTNAADMAEAMNDKVSSTVTTTFTQEVYAIDYFVPVANMASTIGEDANNYFWNLRWAIDEANMDKMYSAVAYIKVGDEYVLMNMARESVETLALDYLTNRGCNENTAEGSLKAIVDNA